MNNNINDKPEADETDARIYRSKKRRIAGLRSRLSMHSMDPGAPDCTEDELDEAEAEIDGRFE